MKFDKKLVKGTTDMYFIIYVRNDGSERMCLETGFAEAFPESRIDVMVEALNKALKDGKLDPEMPVDFSKLVDSENKTVEDSQEKVVAVEAPAAPKKSSAKKVTKKENVNG